MDKKSKAKQIAYFAKNQIDAKNIDKETLVISDPKRAFIGLSIAASNPDVTVILEGEAKAAIDEFMANIEERRNIK